MTNSRALSYIPSKFSRPPSLTTPRRRSSVVRIPHLKQGGGREAFRNGEDRMPGKDDDDYDGVDIQKLGIGRLWPFRNESRRKLPKHLQAWRWNKFKWALLLTTSVVMTYSITALIFCLLTWFNVWKHADVVRVGNRKELVVSTVAASAGIVSSLVGCSGVLLNNRSYLATYNLLLWATFALLLAPGYLTYKQRTFDIEGKLNRQWSESLGVGARLRIQNRLVCCGFYNTFVEATVSNTCYARSSLPACKGIFLEFEKMVLERWYTATFGLVPVQIIAIFTGLLCANHVTYRYGKGMMPKAYRLDMHTMAIAINEYANNLVDRYSETPGDMSRTTTFDIYMPSCQSPISEVTSEIEEEEKDFEEGTGLTHACMTPMAALHMCMVRDTRQGPFQRFLPYMLP